MATWDDLSRGRHCPLCRPRVELSNGLYLVRQLTSCTLYLARDQRYRGTCRAIYDLRHVNRIDELTEPEWRQLAVELWHSQRAVMRTFGSDHINLASLGNEVPHLHWHLIPRYRGDGLWGAPIWRADPASVPERTLRESEYATLAAALNAALEAEACPLPG
ncbi:MAG TPA: HIT family protein [Steroidobacteraceae bacterium]|nr:HIT family protein [Steroidobacteraceae bacterium]